MRWPFHRVNGKRGGVLTMMALTYSIIGYSWITIDSASRNQNFAWMPDWALDWGLGSIWLAAAAIAFISAITYNPPRSDRAGFAALTAAPLGNALAFLGSWMAGYAASGWVSAAIYGSFASFVMIIAGWPNPTDVPSIRGGS